MKKIISIVLIIVLLFIIVFCLYKIIMINIIKNRINNNNELWSVEIIEKTKVNGENQIIYFYPNMTVIYINQNEVIIEKDDDNYYINNDEKTFIKIANDNDSFVENELLINKDDIFSGYKSDSIPFKMLFEIKIELTEKNGKKCYRLENIKSKEKVYIDKETYKVIGYNDINYVWKKIKGEQVVNLNYIINNYKEVQTLEEYRSN